jgi:NAD-dependent deacetylase
MKDQARQCADLIRKAGQIGVLTGAGISTAAGIPDFRGPQGLYVTKRYDPETVFDIQYFYKDPVPFFDFARDFVGLEQNIQPTFTHDFLAGIEKGGKHIRIITQNIDSLHQIAGSTRFWKCTGASG